MQREIIMRTTSSRDASKQKSTRYLVIFEQQTPVGDYQKCYERTYNTSSAAAMDAREWLTNGEPPLAEEDIEELAL